MLHSTSMASMRALAWAGHPFRTFLNEWYLAELDAARRARKGAVAIGTSPRQDRPEAINADTYPFAQMESG